MLFEPSTISTTSGSSPGAKVGLQLFGFGCGFVSAGGACTDCAFGFGGGGGGADDATSGDDGPGAGAAGGGDSSARGGRAGGTGSGGWTAGGTNGGIGPHCASSSARERFSSASLVRRACSSLSSVARASPLPAGEAGTAPGVSTATGGNGSHARSSRNSSNSASSNGSSHVSQPRSVRRVGVPAVAPSAPASAVCETVGAAGWTDRALAASVPASVMEEGALAPPGLGAPPSASCPHWVSTGWPPTS
ncbi:hypothetical protein AEJ54_26440 [Azospirillum sp. Sp 7]|nr:hypothetical protein AEJ54_26440 [Azospirillum sp. Sp 7]